MLMRYVSPSFSALQGASACGTRSPGTQVTPEDAVDDKVISTPHGLGDSDAAVEEARRSMSDRNAVVRTHAQRNKQQQRGDSHPTNLYPIPCTVTMNSGRPGFVSIFCRSEATWTSTVRVTGIAS